MKLTDDKKLFEQVTVEQLRQNIVLLQAKEIEIPRVWVLELLDTIESQQQENEQLRNDLAGIGQMVADYDTALQENEQLQKCYAVTNDHWKRLAAENEIFRADITDANVQMVHRDKMIKQLQAKTLLDVVNSDLVKTYNGSALDKADQYIERLEQENKSLRDKYAKLNDFEQSQCAKLLTQNGMYKATLKQAREALSSGLRNLKCRNTGDNQKILVNMRYAIESIDRAVEE